MNKNTENSHSLSDRRVYTFTQTSMHPHILQVVTEPTLCQMLLGTRYWTESLQLLQAFMGYEVTIKPCLNPKHCEVYPLQSMINLEIVFFMRDYALIFMLFTWYLSYQMVQTDFSSKLLTSHFNNIYRGKKSALCHCFYVISGIIQLKKFLCERAKVL